MQFDDVKLSNSLQNVLSSKKREGKTHFKSGECVRSDVKRGHLHIAEEIFEVLRVEDDFSERLVPDALSQHDPTIQCHLRRLIPTVAPKEKFYSTVHILNLPSKIFK